MLIGDVQCVAPSKLYATFESPTLPLYFKKFLEYFLHLSVQSQILVPLT